MGMLPPIDIFYVGLRLGEDGRGESALQEL